MGLKERETFESEFVELEEEEEEEDDRKCGLNYLFKHHHRVMQ